MFRANSHRLHVASRPVVYRLGHYGPNRVAASQMAARARRRKVLRPDRVSGDEARSPPARSACFPHPVRTSQRGVRAAAEKVYLEIYNDENTMTYSVSDVASRRASPGLDVRAGRPLRSGGPRKVSSGTLGYRVVHFWPIRSHGQTTGLRLGSVVMRLISRGGVLVQASATRELATAL